MKLIRSSQQCRIAAPAHASATEESAAWLASMSDRSWRVLIDTHNWPMWIPGITAVQQTDQESPARGTGLLVNRGKLEWPGSIDHWDPPRRLCFSIALPGGEIAYGLTIQENLARAELTIELELERSLKGPLRLFAPILQWRLRQLGARLVINLCSRIRPIQT